MLGNTVIDAFSKSLQSLDERDLQLAETVIAEDVHIDKKELEINNEALLLIAKQQPVARDLRTLITALKIASDLERMADNAKNISRAALSLGAKQIAEIHPIIKEMGEKAIQMAQIALEAYEQNDASMVASFSEMDDQIDNMYDSMLQQLLQAQAIHREEMTHIMQMGFCARYIERFADHVTNIGESVIFLEKGESYQFS